MHDIYNNINEPIYRNKYKWVCVHIYKEYSILREKMRKKKEKKFIKSFEIFYFLDRKIDNQKERRRK